MTILCLKRSATRSHAIRNSVDRGIESPNVQRAAGKPVEGVARLRTRHEGSHVIVGVQDDGADINVGVSARWRSTVSSCRPPALGRCPNARSYISSFFPVHRQPVQSLVRRGMTALNFNQRSVAEILDMMLVLARIVGKPAEGAALVERLQRGLDEIAAAASQFPHRPRVYFEVWNDPLVSGIEWVEELIEIAGGMPVFPDLRGCSKAQDRVVDAVAVAARNPEVILASWCGRRVNRQAMCTRPGWESISAVRDGCVYEIKSSCILQPGPAALTDGVRQIYAILARAAGADATAPAVLAPPIL